MLEDTNSLDAAHIKAEIKHYMYQYDYFDFVFTWI